MATGKGYKCVVVWENSQDVTDVEFWQPKQDEKCLTKIEFFDFFFFLGVRGLI